MAGSDRSDQYIRECLCKCAHIIASSRSNSSTKFQRESKSKRWFQLDVDETEEMATQLASWRKLQDNRIAVEVTAPFQGDTVLELWVLQYTAEEQKPTNLHRPLTDDAAVYKRLILFVRMLFSYIRILPAYKLYKNSKQRGNVHHTTMKTSIVYDPHLGSESPLSSLHTLKFTPVELPQGRLSAVLHYQPGTATQALEDSGSMALAPNFITDYMSASLPNPGYIAGRVPYSRAVSHNARSNPVNVMTPVGSAPIQRHLWSSKDMPAHHVPTTPTRSLDFPESPPLPGSFPSSSWRADMAAIQAAPSTSPATSHPSTTDPLSLPTRTVSEGTEASTPHTTSYTTTHTTSTTAHRQASAPMRIPRRTTHRVHSMADLEKGEQRQSSQLLPGLSQQQELELQQQLQLQKVVSSSAPVGAEMMPVVQAKQAQHPQHLQVRGQAPSCKGPAMGPMESPASGTTGGTSGGGVGGLLEGASSCSSLSSGFPMSCSPQLPFAFTPASHSFIEPAVLGNMPSPPVAQPVSGRDISSLAVIKRPSWSSRSSSLEPSSVGGVLQLSASITPFGDIMDQLDASSLFSTSFSGAGSNPTPYSPYMRGTSPASSPLMTMMTRRSIKALPDGRGGSNPALDSGGGSDLLPFALDSDPADPTTTALEGADFDTGGVSFGEMSALDSTVGAFLSVVEDTVALLSAGGVGGAGATTPRQLTVSDAVEGLMAAAPSLRQCMASLTTS